MRKILMMVLAASVLFACKPDTKIEQDGPDTPVTPADPETPIDPEKPVDPSTPEGNYVSTPDNTYIIKSTVLENEPFSIALSCSELEGITSDPYECLNGDYYISFNMDEDLIGQEVSLVDANEGSWYFLVMDTKTEESIVYFDNYGMSSDTIEEGLIGGTIKVTLNDNEVICEVKSESINAYIRHNLSEPYQFEKNRITYLGEKKPVRAAFYIDYNDQMYFLVTPGDIEWYEELEDCTSWFFAGVDKTSFGTEMSFPNETASLQYYNFQSAPEGLYEPSDGNLTITNIEGNTYRLEGSITFEDGSAVTVYYEGEFKNGDEKKPQPEAKNIFVYQGSEYELNSVIVEQTDGNWCNIYGCEKPGLEMSSEIYGKYFKVENYPMEYINFEDGVGFSWYMNDLRVIFEETTWQYPQSGNVLLNIEAGDFAIKFTEGFSCQYKGDIVFIPSAQ